jgi:hypothetical protein
VTLCNSAQFKSGQAPDVPNFQRDVIGDPVDAALLRCAQFQTTGADRVKCEHKKVAEIPFNNNALFHLTIHQHIDSAHNMGSILQNSVSAENFLDKF